jgi:hypothetical protein
MQAIYDKVHALGMVNFNEDLTYWTSTKLGYSPYVMNFNIDWGGSFTWSMYKLKWDYDCKKIIIYSFCL